MVERSTSSDVGDDRQDSSLPVRRQYSHTRRSLWLVVVIAATAFCAEFLVMLIIDALPVLPDITEAVVDALLLMVLFSPALYFLVFRPLSKEIETRQQAELALIEARDSAESANRAKGVFLSTISHELLTPMNGVVGMLSLLEESELDDEQREYQAAAVTSVNRLEQMIDDILMFTQLSVDEVKPECASFDLAKLVIEISDQCRAMATPKGVVVELSYDRSLPRQFIGEEKYVARALSILAENAVKFTSQGSVNIDVAVGRDEKGVSLSISDSGIGFEESDLPAILDQFSQADGSDDRPYEGIGLGLALCRRLVDVMGGSLSVQSQKGIGSRFEMYLPLEPGEESPMSGKP